MIKNTGSPSGGFLTPETSSRDVSGEKTLWRSLPEILPDMLK